MPLARLPDDLLERVIEQVDTARGLGRLAGLCRRLAQWVALHDRLWRPHAHRLWRGAAEAFRSSHAADAEGGCRFVGAAAGPEVPTYRQACAFRRRVRLGPRCGSYRPTPEASVEIVEYAPLVEVTTCCLAELRLGKTVELLRIRRRRLISP